MLFPFIRLMENTEIGKSVYNIIFRIEAGAIIKAGAFIMINTVFSLSTPMGVDYVVFWFDMEVQPLATHNAA